MKESDALSLLGVGLRPHHYPEWKKMSKLPLMEVLSDNYLLQKGGPGLYHLSELAERTSLIFHGVGLNIGGQQPLNQLYLQGLKDLTQRFQPLIVSDHLCFTSSELGQSFDLLPIERNEEQLKWTIERVKKVQDFLDRPLTLEYISTYVESNASLMTQSEFLNALAEESGCGILLDVNNVFVCAFNQGFDAREEMLRLHPKHVVQYHIGGHAVEDGYLHDTHAELVRQEVWQLFREAWAIIGPRPCIIERDDDASIEVLLGELSIAEGVMG